MLPVCCVIWVFTSFVVVVVFVVVVCCRRCCCCIMFSIRVSISCTGLLQKHDEKYWFHTPLMKRRKQIVNEWWHWFVDGSLWPIRSLIKSFSNSADNATTTAAAPTKKRRVTGKDLEDYQGYRLWVLDHQDQACVTTLVRSFMCGHSCVALYPSKYGVYSCTRTTGTGTHEGHALGSPMSTYIIHECMCTCTPGVSGYRITAGTGYQVPGLNCPN